MAGLEFKPYLVSFSVTARCDLSCPHCFMDARRNSAELTLREVKEILRELAEFSPYSLLILTGGEPLLRGDIREIVSFSSQLGFVTVLGTSGRFLSRELANALAQEGLRGVSVSVDSADPQYHDSFRGSPGSWKGALSALQNAREAGIETQMNVTLTDQNADQLEDLIELGICGAVRE